MRPQIAFVLLLGFSLAVGEREKVKKKSILDYNEADVERIFQEWEVHTVSLGNPSHVTRLGDETKLVITI